MYPLVPPAALVVYLVCVAGLGILLNTALITALLRRGASGFHGILIQLALTDVLLLASVSWFETWSRNEGAWSFGKNGCIVYLGMEVFASTASVYFIASLALHALATSNLEDKEYAKRLKRDGEMDEEMRSSRHSLVANSDSSTPPRTMNIDYRIANTTVQVTTPIIFVWILATSLSVPEFVLATTIEIDNVYTCSVIDPNHRLNMHVLLSTFELFLPMFLLSIACVLTIIKLILRWRRKERDPMESDETLKLSILLICIYFVMSAPRVVLTAYYEYVSTKDPNKSGIFRNPSLSNGMPLLELILSCMNYSASLLRPVLCIVTVPRLKRVFLPSTTCCML